MYIKIDMKKAVSFMILKTIMYTSEINFVEIRRIGENRVRVLLSARDDSLYHTNTNRQRRPCGFWRRLRGKC